MTKVTSIQPNNLIMKEYILKTNSLTKTYHGVNALNDVSITMESGRIYGLIGQNGAGKTTLMRIVAGLSFPTGGSIELFRQKVLRISPFYSCNYVTSTSSWTNG